MDQTFYRHLRIYATRRNGAVEHYVKSRASKTQANKNLVVAAVLLVPKSLANIKYVPKVHVLSMREMFLCSTSKRGLCLPGSPKNNWKYTRNQMKDIRSKQTSCRCFHHQCSMMLWRHNAVSTFTCMQS